MARSPISDDLLARILSKASARASKDMDVDQLLASHAMLESHGLAGDLAAEDEYVEKVSWLLAYALGYHLTGLKDPKVSRSIQALRHCSPEWLQACIQDARQSIGRLPSR